MVDVEQRALRALEQNMLALAQRVVEQLSGFGIWGRMISAKGK